MNNPKIESAKRVLAHYFEMILHGQGLGFSTDNRVEIEGIVEDIVAGIMDEIKA